MNLLMITWTDIFYAIGDFFLWFFKIMKSLSQVPNVVFGLLIVGVLTYWTMRLARYKKQARRNSTIE